MSAAGEAAIMALLAILKDRLPMWRVDVGDWYVEREALLEALDMDVVQEARTRLALPHVLLNIGTGDHIHAIPLEDVIVVLTGHPLFPEVQPHLQALWRAMDEDEGP
jgi:hypothetical protein